MKRLRGKKSLNNNKQISTGNGLLADVERWTNLYEEHINKKIDIESLSPNTQRAYRFISKALIEFIQKEYDVEEGINTLNEDFINEFLVWISQYRFNSKYGSADYIYNTIVGFLEWYKKHKGSLFINELNEYIAQYDKQDIQSVAEILNRFFGEFVQNETLKEVEKEEFIDRFIEGIFNTEEKLLKKASKATLSQRKASLMAFLTFISNVNSNKHDFTPLYKHIDSFSNKSGATQELKRKKGYSDKEKMLIVDKALREHIIVARKTAKKSYKKYYCAVRDSLLSLIMMYGGLRASEALALRFEDIHDEGDEYVVEVKKGKGNKSRNTMIYKPLISEYLNEYKAIAKGDHLSSTSSNKQMSYNALYNSVKSIIAGTGIDYRGLHAFRHTFASMMASSGDIVLVAELLGHSNLKTTQIYITINDERKREAVRKVFDNS